MRRRPIDWLIPLLLVGVSVLPGCKQFRMMSSSTGQSEESQVAGAKAESLEPPDKYSLRIAPYVFLSDFKLQPDHPLFKDLAGLRDQVYKELRLPSTNRHVKVYLFETREKYEQYMMARYPWLPRRRAFFVVQPWSVGSGEDLLVYTSWSERIQQDLRHELTHALLHSVLKHVPLWLDEGLAEYFELPRDKQGLNEVHLKQLEETMGFRPDMRRLEKLTEVADMTPAEYRESWAWVHMMLRSNSASREVLLRYLQELKVNADPGPLRPRLAKVVPRMDRQFHEHLKTLRAQARLYTDY